jgi:N-methylhydantoinase A
VINKEVHKLHVGVDIGGTFTDFVVLDHNSGDLSNFKLLSTPENPAQAVLQGLEIIFEKFKRANPNCDVDFVITHGSTVATNAILERKGARTALITTRGFRDVLEIGRQNRPALYDFSANQPPPLVSKELRYDINERVDRDGKVLVSIDPEEIFGLVSKLDHESVESVAICLLFSFLHPEHEQMIAAEFRELEMFVSVSSEILPEYREFERTSTTVVNAYVSPVLDRYLTSIEESLPFGIGDPGLRIMQSNGGIIGFTEARQAGVRSILSGPAGGVVGSRYLAQLTRDSKSHKNGDLGAGNDLNVITFDMGGTSTDVSLIADVPSVTTESMIGGYPLQIPVLDIHTIGAGGGSIAKVDIGGALRVGPESAGADPGPACYARRDPDHDLSTVTDANVVLGRLPVDQFLGGRMKLDIDRAKAVMDRLGAGIGLSSIQAARGVIEVVDAHMERALRVVSSEKGFDPGDFALFSFGGAGGLHACNLARRVGILQVIIPPLASTLSAFGMLVTDVIKDYSKTVMLPGDIEAGPIQISLQPLIEQGNSDIKNEGFSSDDISIEPSLDMRYQGQSYELNIPFTNDYLGDFHRFHEHTYGYARRNSMVEIVNIRVRAIGRIKPPQITRSPSVGNDPGSAYLEHRLVHLSEQQEEIPLYQGELLSPGNELSGPAIVVRKDTTIYLGEQDQVMVDPYHNLVVSIGALDNLN